MASLWIAEYRELARDLEGKPIAAPLEPPIAEQKITISGTTAPSAAFHKLTRFVLLHTDTACHIEFGESPTATNANMKIPADGTIFHGVPHTGGLMKVAVIQTS